MQRHVTVPGQRHEGLAERFRLPDLFPQVDRRLRGAGRGREAMRVVELPGVLAQQLRPLPLGQQRGMP